MANPLTHSVDSDLPSTDQVKQRLADVRLHSHPDLTVDQRMSPRVVRMLVWRFDFRADSNDRTTTAALIFASCVMSPHLHVASITAAVFSSSGLVETVAQPL